MKNSAYIVVTFLVCCVIAVAGCTSSQSAATTSGTPSGSSGTTTSGLTTGPTDVMPENIVVTVTVGEKDYLGKIPVTFDGGRGQVNVKKIDVTLIRADGSTQKTTVGSNKGDSIKLDGTRGSGSQTGQADRVLVSVTMNNGQTYKIVDVLREYRTRA
ncbi:MAG TPA: hypothetical protein PKM50_03420 [Methanoregula sp.]|nr:hypothetical protein [Methanoregula sp.]